MFSLILNHLKYMISIKEIRIYIHGIPYQIILKLILAKVYLFS